MNKRNCIMIAFVLCMAICFSLFGAALAEDKAVASIEMDTLPTVTEYFQGDTVSFDGAAIKVTYEDGSTAMSTPQRLAKRPSPSNMAASAPRLRLRWRIRRIS